MTESLVKFSKQGRVGIIRLNRPDFGNAVTREMTVELAQIRREIGYGSDIHVIVITGAGHKAFCTGTDKKGEECLADLRAAAVIGSFDRPVIAALNGDALGQGLEIALACDIRVAADAACFGMPHILKGEIPWDGGTQRLSRLIGRCRAMEMILTGEIVNAAQALDVGLVSRLVATDAVLASAMETADQIAQKGAIALRYAKEAILKGMDMTLEQGLRMEADLYFLLHTTHDRTEGIRAFQEKRRPKFEGK
ncbi:MAG: enoyl-CoA hydratase-related protein [Desulfobacterales bacterium]